MKTSIKTIFLFWLRVAILPVVGISLFSCSYTGTKEHAESGSNEIEKNWKAIDDLKNINREFSAWCRDSGMKKAYLEYFDDNGVILRPHHNPLEGAGALDFLSQFDDSRVQISWEPINGDISSSEDIGYTYGIYTVINKKEKDTTQGTYLMVWKKQKNGDWKLVMESGNSGLGDKTNPLENEIDFAK
ncbi:MAG TPA: nuclear transport factor 2 family protein [Chitinophagaceae bacterium]|nr:nuclear transport factor 2 family protein [Chitinophagaceae bacterium]